MNTPADLLEAYLRALRHDPHAPPPAALDAELARFARLLVQTRAQAGDGARSRVWQRARLAQHRNGTPPPAWKEQSMTTYTASQSKTRTGYLLVAAVGILMFGFIALLANSLRTPPTETSLIAAQQGEATETATATATHTMTPTTTATMTATATPFATATFAAIPTLFDTSSMVPGDLMLTLYPTSVMVPGVILPPTAVPILAIPPADTIDILPYSFGAPDDQGQYSSAITPEAAALAYRFTADRDGMVFAELKSGDMSLVGMSFSVTRADLGGGGGGGGSMGTPSVLLVQGQTLTFGVTAGDEVQIVVGSSFGYTDRALPYTLRVVLNEVIDLGANTLEGSSENRLDGFSNPVALYRFEAEAGESVTIRAAGMDGFDTRLELLDSTMIPLPDISRSIDDDSGPGYDAEIYRYTLPYTGVYYVVVRAGSFGYGSYRLEMSALERPSLDEGVQVVRFNTQDPPELRFSGRAGETVTINLRVPQDARDYRVDTVSLVVLQGDFAIAVYDLQAAMPIPESGVILSGTVILTADTVYTVRVSANGVLTAPSTQDFKLEVSLERN
jgi:hypothetical protein